jgi:hypothetical protein
VPRINEPAAAIYKPINGSLLSLDSARPEAARIQSRLSGSSGGLPGTVLRASRSSRIAAVAAIPSAVAMVSRLSAWVRSMPCHQAEPGVSRCQGERMRA